MLYYEIRKLPKEIDIKNELELILLLFRIKTEEKMNKFKALGVDVVTQAIEAYQEEVVSSEFQELERLRADARLKEASSFPLLLF